MYKKYLHQVKIEFMDAFPFLKWTDFTVENDNNGNPTIFINRTWYPALIEHIFPHHNNPQMLSIDSFWTLAGTVAVKFIDIEYNNILKDLVNG